MSQRDQLPAKPNRRSVRLKDYDYSQPGWYFVTVCTKDKARFLGDIEDHAVILSEIGQIANSSWREIPDKYAHVSIDELIVMPNHIHGIIVISSQEMPCEEAVGSKNSSRVSPSSISSGKITASLSVIIRQYKSRVKRWCTVNGFQHFQWQSRFHEHVIRNEADLYEIRNYIINNALKWSDDDEYEAFHEKLESRTR
jgi:putative transposase